MKPRQFIKAAIGRKAIPLDVLLDQATKSTITLAVEDGTFDCDDLQYLRELAKALQEQQTNPTIPLVLWATASFLSFMSSLISIYRLKVVPLAANQNPRRARFRLRDKALEGTLLAASFLMVRREGKPRMAQAIKKRAMALFPRTWKQVVAQFGDPDDPETGGLAVAQAEAAIEAASVDDLRTILPRIAKRAKPRGKETRGEARRFVDRMATKHYAKQSYTKAEKARLKKINLRFPGEQVSIDAISLLRTSSGR